MHPETAELALPSTRIAFALDRKNTQSVDCDTRRFEPLAYRREPIDVMAPLRE